MGTRKANRAKLSGKADAERLRAEGTLALDARTRLHVIRVDGQQVVVTTDATGLRSITPLQDRFDAVLNEEEAEGGASEPDLNELEVARSESSEPTAGRRAATEGGPYKKPLFVGAALCGGAVRRRRPSIQPRSRTHFLKLLTNSSNAFLCFSTVFSGPTSRWR